MLKCVCYKNRSDREVRQHPTARVGIRNIATHTGIRLPLRNLSLALDIPRFNDSGWEACHILVYAGRR